jgi:hypothetical protein
VISRLNGAFLTGTYVVPLITYGTTFLIVIGMKFSPFTLITVVIGAVLFVSFLGMNTAL